MHFGTFLRGPSIGAARREDELGKPSGMSSRLDRSPSLAGVVQGEIMEAVLLVPRDFAGRGEEAQEQLAEVIGADAVEVVLALAPRLDQPRYAKQGQMMADSGLALAEPLAEVGHVQFAMGRQGQIEQDARAESHRSAA